MTSCYGNYKYIGGIRFRNHSIGVYKNVLVNSKDKTDFEPYSSVLFKKGYLDVKGNNYDWKGYRYIYDYDYKKYIYKRIHIAVFEQDNKKIKSLYVPKGEIRDFNVPRRFRMGEVSFCDTTKAIKKVKNVIAKELYTQAILTKYEAMRQNDYSCFFSPMDDYDYKPRKLTLSDKNYLKKEFDLKDNLSFYKGFRDYKKYNFLDTRLFEDLRFGAEFYSNVTLKQVELKYEIPYTKNPFVFYQLNESGLVAVQYNSYPCVYNSIGYKEGYQNHNFNMLLLTKDALSYYDSKARLYSMFIHSMPAKYKRKKDVKIIDGDTLYRYYGERLIPGNYAPPFSEKRNEKIYYPFKGDPAYLIPYIYIVSWSDYEPEDVFFEKRRGYQLYYTFYSNKHKRNYRLQYNARTGEFVKYTITDTFKPEGFIPIIEEYYFKRSPNEIQKLFFEKQKGKYFYYVRYQTGGPIYSTWLQIKYNTETGYIADTYADEKTISKFRKKYNID